MDSISSKLQPAIRTGPVASPPPSSSAAASPGAPVDAALLATPAPPPSRQEILAATVSAPATPGPATPDQAAILDDPTGEGVNILWGRLGHSVIHVEAARDLPVDMPAFFRDARESLVTLASQPDRWKFPSLNGLNSVNRPDHWINSELLQGHEYPSDRYTFLGMVVNDHLNLPKSQPASVGFLPYRLVEVFEELEAEMALWRHEVKVNGPETPFAKQLQQNVVHTAGLLGHYAGDASQPLHVTAHGKGWDDRVEPNDEGFSSDPGIHARFESNFVNAAIQPGDVTPLVGPARVLQGDIRGIVSTFVTGTHSHVRDLYRLDRDGKLKPADPSPEGTQFVKTGLASGAQFLRDLWYTAWIRSEELEKEVRDPEKTLTWQLAPKGLSGGCPR